MNDPEMTVIDEPQSEEAIRQEKLELLQAWWNEHMDSRMLRCEQMVIWEGWDGQ